MTSPFQSIIGTPENAIEDQVEPNDNSYSEEVAEVAALSIAPEPASAGIETGICAVAKNAAVSTALPPQQRKPLRGGVYTPADVLGASKFTLFDRKEKSRDCDFPHQR